MSKIEKSKNINDIIPESVVKASLTSANEEQKKMVDEYGGEEIIVQKSWLKELLSLSEEVRKDLDKWNYETANVLLPESVSKLTGYASSAKTILKYGKEYHYE